MIKVTGNTNGLERLLKNARELEKKTAVPFLEVMNSNFVSEHSRFSDFYELCRGAGYEVKTTDDFEAIPDAEWEEFIKQETGFGSWNEMQQAAAAVYAKALLLKNIK